MKFSLISFLLLSALVTFSSFASVDVQLNKTGVFKDTHPFGSFGYPNAKACEEDGGVYNDGLCVFQDGGSTIEIKKNNNGKYDLSVSSVGTNMHLCDYEGEAIDLNAVQIISKDTVGDEANRCEIVVAFTSNDTLSVITNGKCQDYCGANMSLDVENAKRSK
ncbi:MAG: hypothetical protein PHY93_07650 [Bacteriovorax sp.]|nr:hypothetical protein [Bacteriovorax sp.]